MATPTSYYICPDETGQIRELCVCQLRGVCAGDSDREERRRDRQRGMEIWWGGASEVKGLQDQSWEWDLCSASFFARYTNTSPRHPGVPKHAFSGCGNAQKKDRQ